ncbi:tryptophan synthase beta subunit-like PLP-dependent enzyme [Serendipita vermifera]|nr:tryptophan synthase beta subunit-like PLP-dependent enzyme [Serendipita vermifera]
MSQIPTIEEIKQAAEIIKDYVHKTPVITSSTLDSFATNVLGRETKLVFKCENFQKVGAFKIRGATHAVRRLLETVPDPSLLTVVTHSSGNHAQALALAARQLGVRCQVVMPSNAPLVKKEAVKGYGAIVTECVPTLEARESTVREIIQRLEEEAAQSEMQYIVRLVPPYDHLDIVRGQGTISLELLSQAEELNRPLDIVIAPVGGGGMLSGVSVAAKNLSKDILVFGAEPTGASDAQQSFRSKTFHPSVQPKTIADGLLTSLGEITFPLILQHVDDIFTVTDQEIAKAMKLIWERLKIVVEPSSCVTLAVVLYSTEFKERIKSLAESGRPLNIGLVLSGGNVDLGACLSILSGI